MYWWAPLLHPLDRAPALADADIPRRVAIFADAYGMNPQLRQELVPFADQMIHLFHRSFRAAAETRLVTTSPGNPGKAQRDE